MDVKKILRNLLRTGSSEGEKTVLVFNAKGDVFSAFVCTPADGTWHSMDLPVQRKSLVPCTLVLPAGAAALRKSPVPKDTEKDVAEVLRAEAERTLLRKPELGCGDIRMVSSDHGITGVMAWLPSEFLYRCFEQAVSRGFTPKGVIVPEYHLKFPEPTLLVSCLNDTVRFCIIDRRTPAAWQSIPARGPDAKKALEAVLSEAREFGIAPPRHILVWDGAGLSDTPGSQEARRERLEQAADAAVSLFPSAQLHRPDGFDGRLSNLLFYRGTLFSHGKTAFRPSLSKWESTPLAPKDLVRLSVPIGCAILGCLLMFMAVVNLYDKEAEALSKEASQLKIMAARSDEATRRIRTLGERRRNILRYTTGKPFVFTMFRSLSKAAPERIRVTDLRLSRVGEVTVNGEAVNEVSLISFLTNLNTSRYFDNAVLSSMTRVKNTKKVKFVVVFEYSPWKTFFEQESEWEE